MLGWAGDAELHLRHGARAPLGVAVMTRRLVVLGVVILVVSSGATASAQEPWPAGIAWRTPQPGEYVTPLDLVAQRLGFE